MTLAQRRPTPEQAERMLRAILNPGVDYYQRRALGYCASVFCASICSTAYCEECRRVRRLKLRAAREGMAA
jgi:hypothetical protein